MSIKVQELETNCSLSNIEGCDICGGEHLTDDCPDFSSVLRINDTVAPSRARLTLPLNLILKTNGVFAKEKIPKGARFGPFQGFRQQIIQDDDSDIIDNRFFQLKVFNSDGTTTQIQTWDENICNWMCLVSAAKDDEEQNLAAYQVQQDVYFSAKRDIKAREELRVWYAPNYGRKMGVDCLQNRHGAECNGTQVPAKKRRGRPRVVKQDPDGALMPGVICEPIPSVQSLPSRGCSDADGQTRTTRKRKIRTDSDYIYYEKSKGPSEAAGPSSPESDKFDELLEEMVKSEQPGEQVVTQQNKKRGWKRGRKRKAVKNDPQPEADVPLLDENKDSISNVVDLDTGGVENVTVQIVESGNNPKWACSMCSKIYEDCVHFAFHLRSHFKPRVQSLQRGRRFPCQYCAAKLQSPRQLHYHKIIYHAEIMRAVRSCGLMKGTRQMKAEAICGVLKHCRVQKNSGHDKNNISDVDAASILLQIEANAEKLESAICAVTDFDAESVKVEPVIGRLENSESVFTDCAAGKMSLPGHRRIGLYSCDICGRRFDRRLSLFRHLRKHTASLRCTNCLGVFVSEDILSKHNCQGRIICDKEKPGSNSCHICKKSFPSKHLLRKHLAKHEEQNDTLGDYACKHCGQFYTCAESLANHMCAVRPGNGYECEVCHKTFSKLKYLNKHFPMHTGVFTCTICGKWLRSRDSLANHMRICGQVSELETNGFAVCSNCRAEFTDVREFRRHLYEHTHAFACEICGARFRNKASLTVHVCKAKYVVNCDECGKSFHSVAFFDSHRCSDFQQCQQVFQDPAQMASHACGRRIGKRGPRGPRKQAPGLCPLVCEICGSRFSSTSSLNVHRNLHGEKRFVCEVCGKRFHRKDLMLEHRAVHSAPAVPCPVCDKMFKTKKSLDVHLLIHDGTKRFSCTTCGKQFYQKGNLLKHEETHNPGRRYSCQHCNKAFGTKEYLAIHVLEHTRGRIYQCSLCDKNFVKEHQLKAHERIFHSNLAYVCKFCGLTVKLRHSLKRHLEKKHSDLRHEWQSNTSMCDMLTAQECAAATELLVSVEDAAAESQVEMGDLASMQGAEVLLAVAGIDGAALQQALAAGTARIQQGSAPNTIEISLPMTSDGVDGDGDYTLSAHVVQMPIDGSQECKDLEDSARFHFEVNPCDGVISSVQSQEFVVNGSGGEDEDANELQETGTVLVEAAEDGENSANVLLYVLTTGDSQDASV